MGKQKKDKELLGKLELRIMHVLWERGASTCREVFNVINSDDSYAYTTILTMMKHLEKKGLVSYTEKGRAFVYVPEVTKQYIENKMTRDFVSSVFSGSSLNLVNALIKEESLSREELDQIETLIQKMRRVKDE